MLTIKTLLTQLPINQAATIHGWVKNKRGSKNVLFVTLQDGSSFAPLQIVIDPTQFKATLCKQITVGASLRITGKVVTSPGSEQQKELSATHITILGHAPSDYPLQPKRHTLAFMRTIQHLRLRTNTFSAVFRVRHALSYAIHTFFHERGFLWIHTPIITSVDAEGAGEVFKVTTPEKKGNFFGKKVALTVSGQLPGEAAALSLGKIYTFGPTFRAENSNTPRHLAEFWMVEPEMAFYTLKENIALAIEMIKYCLCHVLTHCKEEMAFLEKRMRYENKQKGQATTPPLRERLAAMAAKNFTHITYTDAIALLKAVHAKAPQHFPDGIVPWGADLHTAHERYLTKHFEGGVVVTDYPKGIKAFYMRQNDDGKSVAAMDILLPGVGEIVGGSQREERLDLLKAAMTHMGLDLKELAWYLDTRRFGTVPHSGFGLGFERLVLLITGMDNIRDVIPFPRTPDHAMC